MAYFEQCAKFPRLQLLDMKSITDICHYVLSLCISHNFRLTTGEEIVFDDEVVGSDNDQDQTIGGRETNKEAERKRFKITEEINNL